MDVKPKLSLGKHVIQDEIEGYLDSPWTLAQFKERFRCDFIRSAENELEFDLVGIPAALANAFRRLVSDVPSMAIEKVVVANNTSIMPDEVLAQRLGLIPLKADARLFDYRQDTDSTDCNENDSLEFTLKIRCSTKKDGPGDSSRAEDLYENSTVYSDHIKWQPVGGQSDRFVENMVGPIHKDIIIVKLRPGHELDLRLIAVKGIGRDHAKFLPVSVAFYRLLTEIRLVKEVVGEAADRLQACFPAGAIDIVQDSKNGVRKAVVKNARADLSSRNVYRYDDLKECVELSKIQDHFVLESLGALEPHVIFTEAVQILKNKCLDLLDELKGNKV